VHALQDAVDLARAVGVAPRVGTERSLEALPAILELAIFRGPDLVVIGSGRRDGRHRLPLGSIAEQAARFAPCPVLIVPETAHPATQRAEA
jgi:nucleotide-binding universal stress UspA family protein